ncbi:MAG TPA: aldehyde dehydrogenase family protein [Burkholderiaceae bacterium]
MNNVADMPLAHTELDAALQVLDDHKRLWVQTTVQERLALLVRIKECLMPVAQDWAEAAARKKGLPVGSPLAGEEWISGPYAVMAYCNATMQTLSKVAGRRHLEGLPQRDLPNGQLAVQVLPHSIWDHLLLSGVSAHVWMAPGVTRANLAQHTASVYNTSAPPEGKVALVLGAGNIAAIAPLDCLHKLFVENQVAILKMNPINAYLSEFLEAALAPLIERGFLRIVQGDVAVGQYLCHHDLVEAIHITGSGAAHDAIVWGSGSDATQNKLAGTPKNKRPITSELGGVGPTIVVPGPWSDADLRFQAEHVATQKLHNSGFNCIACQVLILPKRWSLGSAFAQHVNKALSSSSPRPLYYPGAKARIAEFQNVTGLSAATQPTQASQCVVAPFDARSDSRAESFEVFGPAMGITELDAGDAESFLIAAVEYANQKLAGTLGANILIHPRTIRQIGRKRFEVIIAELHYGCIGINAWSGLGFLSPTATWGAFPGHTLDDVQSGIGVVHNTLQFERAQRTVIEAPFKPFPRNLLSLSFSLLPRPPWFITNRRAHVLGRLLTQFQYRPSFTKLPLIFFNALRG